MFEFFEAREEVKLLSLQTLETPNKKDFDYSCAETMANLK